MSQGYKTPADEKETDDKAGWYAGKERVWVRGVERPSIPLLAQSMVAAATAAVRMSAAAAATTVAQMSVAVAAEVRMSVAATTVAQMTMEDWPARRNGQKSRVVCR